MKTLQAAALILSAITPIFAQCSGGSSQIPVLRIPDPLQRDKTVFDTTTATECSQKDMKRLKALKVTADEPFRVTMSCSGVSDQSCGYAKASIEAALGKIGQAFRFRKTVTVNAKFRSFCKGESSDTCSLFNVLGMAAPSALLLAKREGDDTSFWYPQGLVKQFVTTKTIDYAPYDVVAEFNADYPFYYPSNPASVMSSKQFDFEYIAAHELLHGLGFTTLWRLYDSNLSPQITKKMFIPVLKCTDGNTVATLKCEDWFGLTVYDKYLYDKSTNTPLMDHAKTFFQRSLKGMTYNGVTSMMYGDSNLYTRMQSALNAATSGSQLYFKNQNTSVQLYAPAKYAPSSSVAHVDTSTYQSTIDFIMAHDASSKLGIKFENVINKPGMVGCLGPLTRFMMSSMGWPTENSTSQVLAIEDSIDLNETSSFAERFAVGGAAFLLIAATFIY